MSLDPPKLELQRPDTAAKKLTSLYVQSTREREPATATILAWALFFSFFFFFFEDARDKIHAGEGKDKLELGLGGGLTSTVLVDTVQANRLALLREADEREKHVEFGPP